MPKLKIFFSILLLISWFYPLHTFGEMTSTNYTIYADSIGWSGVYSTSTSYDLHNTIGGTPAGFTTSTTYEVRGGYQSAEVRTLTMTISNSSLDLGDLNFELVKTASTIVTITADSITGYTLSVGDTSGTGLAGVSDGQVTARSEEYGVAVSGAEAAFADDRAVGAGLILASANSPVASHNTTLTFKAAISSATPVGSWSQNVTLSASANF